MYTKATYGIYVSLKKGYLRIFGRAESACVAFDLSYAGRARRWEVVQECREGVERDVRRPM